MLLTKLATWAKSWEMPGWNQLMDQMLNSVSSYIHLLLFPVWFGVLFVRQGLYQGGIFRFCVHIPEAFPDGGCPVSS
jgi:ubiquitin-protein ligase